MENKTKEEQEEEFYDQLCVLLFVVGNYLWFSLR